MMKHLCTFNHPCLSPIICCCDPIPGNGPIVVSHFYPRGSVQSLLDNPIGKSGLTPTIKATLICELVCGLCYLHSEGVVHGGLKPCKLLLDDHLHLHISGFPTTALLAAKIVSAKKAGHANHAAPEVFERKDSSNSALERRSKVDIYSLGFIIYELFGNTKWAENLDDGEIARRGRENIRPPLPGGINVRLGDLICRCSMHFQFASDVQCECVVERGLAVGPSDLIIASLPDAIPEFVKTKGPVPSLGVGDRHISNGSDRAEVIPPFSDIISRLNDRFPSLPSSSGWRTWADLPKSLQMAAALASPKLYLVYWRYVARFVGSYCGALIIDPDISDPWKQACMECRIVMEVLRRSRSINPFEIVEAETRKLLSALSADSRYAGEDREKRDLTIPLLDGTGPDDPPVSEGLAGDNASIEQSEAFHSPYGDSDSGAGGVGLPKGD
jgi:serine/threonine protein kinase